MPKYRPARELLRDIEETVQELRERACEGGRTELAFDLTADLEELTRALRFVEGHRDRIERELRGYEMDGIVHTLMRDYGY